MPVITEILQIFNLEETMKLSSFFIAIPLYLSTQLACAEIILLEDQRFNQSCYQSLTVCGDLEGDIINPENPFEYWNTDDHGYRFHPSFISEITNHGFYGFSDEVNGFADTSRLAFTFLVTEDTWLDFSAYLYEQNDYFERSTNHGYTDVYLKRGEEEIFNFSPNPTFDGEVPEYGHVQIEDSMNIDDIYYLEPGEYSFYANAFAYYDGGRAKFDINGKFLNAPPVPIPSALFMFIPALGAFAFTSRKKRKTK